MNSDLDLMLLIHLSSTYRKHSGFAYRPTKKKEDEHSQNTTLERGGKNRGGGDGWRAKRTMSIFSKNTPAITSGSPEIFICTYL
jgi:hypothetical protein